MAQTKKSSAKKSARKGAPTTARKTKGTGRTGRPPNLVYTCIVVLKPDANLGQRDLADLKAGITSDVEDTAKVFDAVVRKMSLVKVGDGRGKTPAAKA